MTRLAFVTGANGFVGSNLVRGLFREGWSVRGLARETSDLSFLDGLDVPLVRGDLTDEGALRRGAEGADVVFHVAALASDWGPWRTLHRTNVVGTANVVAAAAAAGARRLVHVSSASVHGFAGYRDRVETDPTPRSPYPYVETKRRAEEIVRRHGIEHVIVRPGNVYGPRDRITSLPMLEAMRKGWMGVLDGGRRLTCPTYVGNLVEALVLAADAPCAAGRVYIVTDGLEITWRGWLDALAAALGVASPRLSLPSGIARRVAFGLEAVYRSVGATAAPPLTRYRVANGANDYHFSVERARRELGWSPRIGLEEACSRTAEWFLSRKR